MYNNEYAEQVCCKITTQKLKYKGDNKEENNTATSKKWATYIHVQRNYDNNRIFQEC
jgi:hypothetical protein